MTGRQVGRNILRSLRGQEPKRFRFTGLGDACGLGRRRAIAQLWGIELTGIPAWIVWRSIFMYFVPTFERQIRILFDWILTPILGRDIVEVRVREPFGLRREHYEAGQPIVREGELGQKLYLIWQGEVEVTREGPATVRALTRVEVVAVGGQEARTLSETIRPFGEAISRKPGADGTAVGR
jgi:NADH dehydrogenase